MRTLYFCPVVSFFFFFLSFFSSPNLSRRRLDVYHTSAHANLYCRSEVCCTRLAGNAGPKKSPKSRYLGTIAQVCRAIASQLRHISTIGKNLSSSNITPTRSHNMVNFGPLAAEIRWRVWGILANFNGFRVLVALLHGILVSLVSVSQTLRR